MSSLYKLSISGIRSFSPKDHETIQFGSPLTLICGQNGCGKTTIIEALKFVTTGDLPPNSKGGAFVNDPAVADRLLVNAEIKLGFISVGSKLMTVTRNMQLNRKRAARGATLTSNTFKSLEGQLAVIADGTKTSYSTKNLELDTRVPMYLGASKAVLEYVIFCHQDDSLWPLSEAGVLKKRFDEIFEALKFTKALDSLKSIRKDMTANIRLIEQSVQHSRIDRARAQKIRERVLESTRKVELFSAEIAELTVHIDDLELQAERLFHTNQAFEQILSEDQRLRVMLQSADASLRRLEASTELLPETEAELSDMLANFVAANEEKKKKLAELGAALLNHEQRLKTLGLDHRTLVREEGALLGKKSLYEQDTAQFAGLTLDLCAKYSLDSLLADFDLLKALELRRIELETASAVAENAQKRTDTSRALQDARNGVLRASERLSHAQNDVELLRENITRLRASLAVLLGQEDSLEMERAKLDSLRARHTKRMGALDLKRDQDHIDGEKAKVAQLEREIDELAKKISAASNMHDMYSKMDLLRESLAVNTSVLQKYSGSHGAEFARLVGTPFEPSSCESALEHVLAEKNADSERVAAQADESRNTCNTRAMALEVNRKHVRELETHIAELSEKVRSVVEPEEVTQFDRLLAEAEEDFKTAQFNCNTFEVTRSYKTKAISVAQESGCCALCNRSMTSAEQATFVHDVQSSILLATLERLQSDIESTSKDLAELRSIQLLVSELQRLQGQLEEARQQVLGDEDALRAAETEVDAAEKRRRAAKATVDALKELVKPTAKVASLAEECASLESQIARLEREFDNVGADSVSVGELQRQQQQKAAEMKVLRQALEDAVEEKSGNQRELARLESQVKDKEIAMGRLELALNKARTTQLQIRELESRVAAGEQQILDMQRERDALEAETDALEEQTRAVHAECDAADAERNAQLARLNTALESVRDLQRRVVEYEQRDAPQLEQNGARIAEVKKTIEGIETERTAAHQRWTQLSEEISGSLNRERKIQDNIEYRQTSRDRDALQTSLDALDVAGAEAERELYQTKSKQLRDRLAKLNSQHYGKVGEVKQINDQIQALQKELGTDYCDVELRYESEWISLQTNMLVSTDLHTYAQALDGAIMKYHSMKMDEINRILRELWMLTYKGTDIDGIEIKCEVSTHNKARSYNYRVVMYKRSLELDMRGRCSAGQKVLASILIRLALAECFGTNCGMIALDEPTTNLDAENAESLAHALNNIVALRKNQKNFQLIVITHDEKFLGHIDGDRFTDNFYRIERDQNQHSVIKSLPIHLMRMD